MHRSFISQRNRGKKGEKVSRVALRGIEMTGRVIMPLRIAICPRESGETAAAFIVANARDAGNAVRASGGAVARKIDA